MNPTTFYLDLRLSPLLGCALLKEWYPMCLAHSSAQWMFVEYVVCAYPPPHALFFLLARPHGLLDLRSQTRDQTCAPGSESTES